MSLRINSDEANFRATPSTSQAPLARLPAGHLVVETGEADGNWRPCRTTIDGHALEGFVHISLLRPEINPEVDLLVELAGVEYRSFLFGTRHETHPDSVRRIGDYWRALPSVVQPVSVAWSAVFISFVVRSAHLQKSFKFAEAHTTYMSDSKRAKLRGDTSRAYWAVPLNERKLQIGDLIGAYRTGPGCGSAVKTYESLPGDFCSHSDLVVAIRDGKAFTIGGNVSNTVKAKEVPLTATGRVPEGSKRITIMARNF
ncbi:MAG TPA: DUF2272 domain-containing protein [Thermoanaerobaculia bacterium]|jgi:hypothetical protein|nr:DUF2272 domain-containing protein [Thermoanaerobaculia bacterium]